jgi:tetratricopeptide (TPR) repeat protein
MLAAAQVLRRGDLGLLGAPLLCVTLAVACGHGNSLSVSEGQTFGELRAIKGDIAVRPQGASARAPLSRERLVDAEIVSLPPGALSWMRRDAGATWLVKGPAQLTVHINSVELTKGRAFVDTESGPPVVIDTPRGRLELSDARASIDVANDGDTSLYVLRGSARAGKAGRAGPGELLTLHVDGTSALKAQLAWDDWTGGLATADPAAEPSPFGMGTVGARPAGEKGKPRFRLVVQRLDVKVTVDHDFAITEVDQTFVNPSSDTVEGIFTFRTPPLAVLHRFGVDRDGDLIWGKIQESASAARQYESNVYAGSTDDPALLQWAGRGAYSARLYPIAPGASRRVVTRYAEWLPRQGPNGERRLYVYPIAAEGARASLPRIEEFTLSLDLARAGAKVVRAGMGGSRDGDRVIVKAFDFVPRADLAVELFDAGQRDPVAYRAKHALTAEDAPERAETDFADKVSKEEPDYLLVPLRATPATAPNSRGLDIAIVADTSAATEPGALAIARSMVAALLAHLGPEDRAALWAGDATLRPVCDGSGTLTSLEAAKRRAWLAALSGVERGGATDLGALLTEAANKLDPKRQGAVIYIGDGQPTVGELAPKALRERLARLPQSTRVLVAALGSNANLPLLDKLARGAPVELIADAYGAARAALRLLEVAGRPLWLGAAVDLGSHVERLLPRELPPIGPEQNAFVVGRVTGSTPSAITIRSNGVTSTGRLDVVELADAGDLRRRWGEARLAELIEDGAGRSALVELARRFGLVSPFTSLYVPTRRELENAGQIAEARARELADRRRRWKPWLRSSEKDAAAERETESDNREGGTGTRAKGEEGSMGNPTARSTNRRYAVQGPRDNADPRPDRRAAMNEARNFGMIGMLDTGAGGEASPQSETRDMAPNEPTSGRANPAVAGDIEAPRMIQQTLRAAAEREIEAKPPATDGASARGNMWGDDTAAGDHRPRNAHAASPENKLTSGIRARADECTFGDPLCDEASGSTVNDPVAVWGLSGIGSGHGRLSAEHATVAPSVTHGEVSVTGRLPSEVVQRIVRQNYGRFRMCYEQGLLRNPNLQGRVSTRFVIGQDGAVSNMQNSGSNLPDSDVVQCVINAYNGLSFPVPEAGVVTVVYPLVFAPGRSVPSRQNFRLPNAKNESRPQSSLGTVGHVPHPCGPGADLPLDERRQLWRERLSSAGSAGEAIAVYRQAIADCEAPGWRERQHLLVYMVDRLRSVGERVALWRALLNDSGAADAVFRSMAVRVQSAAELRELHAALGLSQIDPTLLASLMAHSKSAEQRLELLHGAALRWPDDLELGLQVLDAYEDAGDVAGGRAWARHLRRRVDATAHVHTNVGEYYLRLSEHEVGAVRERDANEARRAFGELVEFAPEDPAARRRLGDLLRAHGWHEEAFRQYETLELLTPDDPAVSVLLAAAADGMGKVEEGVRWAEKAITNGSPEESGELSRAARALARVYLAWARDEAKRAGRNDEAERLLARARRLAAGDASNAAVRVILTWSHPELHPALWSNAAGALIPATDNYPLFGVAETALPASQVPVIQVRLDKDDAVRAARLRAEAVVTAIVGEATADERIAHLTLDFGTTGRAFERLNVRLENGVLHQEAL